MNDPNWLHRQLQQSEENVKGWPRWKLREAGIDHLFPEAEMNWTNTEPTVPGWYWYRKPGWEAELYRLVPFVNSPTELHCVGLDTDWPLDGSREGEWYGPIEEPK